MERYKRVSLVQGCALMVVVVLLLHRGNTESFSCTPSLSEPVCNGSIVTCTCEATPIKSNSATRWNFTNVAGVCNNSNSFITLSLPTPCNILNGICGPYLSAAVVFVGGICTNTSVLNITADPHLNGLEITCIDMSFHPVMHIIGNATLRVTGNAASFSCTLSKPMCPGSIATCTCVVNGNNSFTRFNFTNLTLMNGCNYSAIDLSQPSLCDFHFNGTCGPYLSAAVVFVGGICTSTSVLNITADHHLNGLEITCIDMSFHPVMHIIGNATLRVTASPGPVGNMTVTSTFVDQLTVTWTPPTTGGVPTSYNVTINDSRNTQASIPANGSLQYIFTNLTNGTLYTVSVVAINCAGSSNGTNGTGQSMGTPGPTSPGISSSPAGQGEDGGAIGGAVGGALLVVGVGVVIAACCIWKNQRGKGETTKTNRRCCCDGPDKKQD